MVEPSTAKRTLRAVSIVITLISIVTFSTVAYSAYAEYQALASLGSSSLKFNARNEGTAIVIVISGAIPNEGLYPVDIQLSMEASIQNRTLAKADSNVIRIMPMEVKNSNITAKLDLISSANESELSRILFNGSDIELIALIKSKLEPFASIAFGQRSSFTLPPLISNLSVSNLRYIINGSRQQAAIDISFLNKANLQFPFKVSAELKGNLASINSSVYSANSAPGQIVTITLYFDSNLSQIGSGPYQVILHFSIFDKSISYNAGVIG